MFALALLAALTVHEPIHQGNLTIFPVTTPTTVDASAFITLDEGLRAGLVKVGELGALRGTGAMSRPIITGRRGPAPPITPSQMGDGARVNELAIQNLSDKPLLLIAGEIVTGGKQDRVLGRDLIVPPRSEPIALGVFCVEPGRWHGLNAQFGASKAMAHPNLRKQVTEAKDQSKVWEEVGNANRMMAAGVPAGATAASSFAVTMAQRPVQEKLTADSRHFLDRLPRGATGVVIAVNGRTVWADLFASAALFDRYREKLLQSYVVEAMRAGRSDGRTATVADARDFLRKLEGKQSIDVEPGVYRLTRTDAAAVVTYELESLAPKTAALHFARMAN